MRHVGEDLRTYAKQWHSANSATNPNPRSPATMAEVDAALRAGWDEVFGVG